MSIPAAPGITPSARAYRERMFPGYDSPFLETDPEFMERFDNFAFDEVVNAEGLGGGDLDDRTRFLAVLSALVGCQGVDMFRAMAHGALETGLEPTALKELVYQSTAYVGIGRALPFLRAANEVLEARCTKLPLKGRATTTMDTRRETGNQVQVDIFGEGMRASWERGPKNMRHINAWLADNCFGDWYTRGGLDVAERELITFCFLAAQGGCEPQLVAHALGNFNVGNDYAKLVKVVSQCVPYIGYPRCLNVLRCIDEAVEAAEAESGGTGAGAE